MEVVFYKTERGKIPFLEWINNLHEQTKLRIIARLKRLSVGNFGDCKSVGNGVSELRIDLGPGYRVYFGREGNSIVVVLAGGAKKSQERDIEKAKEYWHDYQERKEIK